MLGFLLIYFIGKYYYNLAGYHDKNKWTYAIIGVAAYYAGTLLFGVIAGFVLALSTDISVDDVDSLLLGLICLPFGVGATALLYYLLKKNWEKKRNTDLEMIEQIGLPEDGLVSI